MKFFSADGKLYKFISRLWDIMKLNFLWVVCSLPIITIGVSTLAAYTEILKMLDDQEGYVARGFLKAFKQNFKQGMALGPLTILFVAAVVADFMLAKNSVGFVILGVISTFMFTIALIYTYPLLARYENTVINSIKNSMKISIRYFGRTCFTIGFLVVEAIVFSYQNFFTLVMGVLVGPMCMMMTVGATALIFFKEIEKAGGAIMRTEDNEAIEDIEDDIQDEK